MSTVGKKINKQKKAKELWNGLTINLRYCNQKLQEEHCMLA